MHSVRTTILASAAIVLILSPAAANEVRAPLLLAQAETAATVPLTPLEQAEADVEAARATLRNAMAGNGNVREARRELRQALQRLNDVAANPEAATAEPEGGETETTVATEPAPQGETPVATETPAQPLPPLDQILISPEGTITQPAPQTAQPETPAQPQVAPSQPQIVLPAPDVAPPAEPQTAETTPPPTEGGEGEAVAVQTEDDGRVIVREGGRLEVRSDDSARLEGEEGARREVERGADGSTTATITRPNGTQVVTVQDADGEVIQRYRRRPNGQIDILIGDDPRTARRDDRRRPDRDRERPLAELLRALPQLTITIPQSEYVVESDQASQQELERALTAPPVEQIERTYTLSEVRGSGRLRNKLRRIDVDTITFEFGSATIPGDQIARMQQIGDALSRVINRNPGEVFLVEGHTDAVGTDLANLALSDRRAESVAYVLATYYGIPPENLVTQGYGEYYLKVPTTEAERENRRVTLRRITPLLRGG